jgi:hypothetical protein
MAFYVDRTCCSNTVGLTTERASAFRTYWLIDIARGIAPRGSLAEAARTHTFCSGGYHES